MKCGRLKRTLGSSYSESAGALHSPREADAAAVGRSRERAGDVGHGSSPHSGRCVGYSFWSSPRGRNGANPPTSRVSSPIGPRSMTFLFTRPGGSPEESMVRGSTRRSRSARDRTQVKPSAGGGADRGESRAPQGALTRSLTGRRGLTSTGANSASNRIDAAGKHASRGRFLVLAYSELEPDIARVDDSLRLKA
jgi:hypothetical protein